MTVHIHYEDEDGDLAKFSRDEYNTTSEMVVAYNNAETGVELKIAIPLHRVVRILG